MNIEVKNHRNGVEVVPDKMVKEIKEIFSAIHTSVEKYVISDIRKELITGLQIKGWSDKIYLDRKSKISITGEQDDIGLCIQTGNVSRVYADLLKLQTLFVQGEIKAGIIIVPTSECGKQYASNTASMERLMRELNIFNQVITMPLVVIGFSE